MCDVTTVKSSQWEWVYRCCRTIWNCEQELPKVILHWSTTYLASLDGDYLSVQPLALMATTMNNSDAYRGMSSACRSVCVNLISLLECKGPRRVGAKSFASAGKYRSAPCWDKVDHFKAKVFTSQFWLKVFHSILYGPYSGHQRPRFY